MIEEIKQRAQNKRYEYHYVDTESWAEPLDVTEDVTYLLDQNKALVEALEYAKGAIKQLGKMDDPDKIERFSEVALAALTTYKGGNGGWITK